jgi:probable F420-dependent oxidoreductase
VQASAATRDEWHALARKLEQLGFSTLVVSDHFGLQLAPLLALVSAASATTSLRLGAVVMNNDFRHPALLAKEAATADVLTDGRFEFGVGAGWMAADYAQTGLPFDAPGPRLARLTETVRICKSFFSGEPVGFDGAHYQLNGLTAFPNVVQRPYPPLMIGGRQRRMLELAAREADIVGISMLEPGGPTRPFADKVAWVRAAAGDRYPQLELQVMVSDVGQGAASPPSPTRLVGDTEAIVDQLETWRARCDVSYFVFRPRAIDVVAPVVARLAGC